MPEESEAVDLFIIGGGVNGCGIARDAAGRGLSVALAEKGDLAQATSSASSKLFHGGLRYLEYFKFRLVREALREREVLLRAMPHISWPMRFVLPHHDGRRFEAGTPVSRLLWLTMPWLRGRRPAWMIRSALWLYDHLGGREILPGTRTLDLANDPAGRALKPEFTRAFEYSDCWVDDARLVVLNARDAQARGATIMTRCTVAEAARDGAFWTVRLRMGDGAERVMRARALVNAGGPWAGQVIRDVAHLDSRQGVRLVRGSHIVTRRLFDHDRAYFLQGSDGRIIFAMPYEQDFTLIGTTDVDHPGPEVTPECSDEEADYLCEFASRYFRAPVTRDDIVWRYSGVRPLFDDGASSATAATRDYVLTLDEPDGAAPLLNVFGGKITTYRRLSEQALARLRPFFPAASGDWTAGVPLPGGDFAHDGAARLAETLRARHGFLDATEAHRLVRAYGTEAAVMLEGAARREDLGEDFGAGLSAREVDWLCTREFARSADDILWRRSKLGLRIGAEGRARLEAHLAARAAG